MIYGSWSSAKMLHEYLCWAPTSVNQIFCRPNQFQMCAEISKLGFVLVLLAFSQNYGSKGWELPILVNMNSAWIVWVWKFKKRHHFKRPCQISDQTVQRLSTKTVTNKHTNKQTNIEKYNKRCSSIRADPDIFQKMCVLTTISPLPRSGEVCIGGTPEMRVMVRRTWCVCFPSVREREDAAWRCSMTTYRLDSTI